MSDVVLVAQRIEPGKTERLREWLAEIQSRREEAVETLENEGVYTETAFIDSRADGDYLLTYMEAADLERAFEAYESSSHDIDREHQGVLEEVLVDEEPERVVEPGYHVANPDRP